MIIVRVKCLSLNSESLIVLGRVLPGDTTSTSSRFGFKNLRTGSRDDRPRGRPQGPVPVVTVHPSRPLDRSHLCFLRLSVSLTSSVGELDESPFTRV